MKMAMTLRTKESGTLNYSKVFSEFKIDNFNVFGCQRPGAILETGGEIATMTLDDPGQCRGATLYEGPGFPPAGQDRPAPPRSLHREYLDVLSGLENVLAGFCPPEKYFKVKIQNLTREFLRLLQDRRLPLDEMRDVMATISGRLPSDLEKFIGRCLTNYEQNITRYKNTIVTKLI